MNQKVALRTRTAPNGSPATSPSSRLSRASSPLRRDQVWLTEKDGEGATTVYPLTDYKPRKSENLERGYLQGRYGAIPFLGPLAPAVE